MIANRKTDRLGVYRNGKTRGRRIRQALRNARRNLMEMYAEKFIRSFIIAFVSFRIFRASRNKRSAERRQRARQS